MGQAFKNLPDKMTERQLIFVKSFFAAIGAKVFFNGMAAIFASNGVHIIYPKPGKANTNQYRN